jgi:hypothetical protein
MYLRAQVLLLAILLAILAGFNYVVDPYGVYSPDHSYQFNHNKTEFFMKEPVIKPYRVSDMRPDTVILGASRAGFGYDENHAYFDDKKVYNFSMAGASMYMIYRAFQHTLHESELKHVALDLSMTAFDEHHALVVRDKKNAGIDVFEELITVREDGSKNWLSIFRKLAQIPRFLLSYQATKDSIKTLQHQGSHQGWHLNNKGGWRGSTLPPGTSQGKRFVTILHLLTNGYFSHPSSSQSFSIYRENGELSRSFGYFENLLDDAYKNDIDMTLIFSPSHVFFYEAVDYHELGKMYVEWKRQIILINTNIAAQYRKEAFPVWDFAYYSWLNAEMVPEKSNQTARMRWHYDPLHFNRAAGNHVLDQVYLNKEGTGVLLSASNLDAEMSIQAQKKKDYREENKAVIENVKDIMSRAAARFAKQN